MTPGQRHAAVAAFVFAFAMLQCSQASTPDTFGPVALGAAALIYGWVRLGNETGRDYLDKNFLVTVDRLAPVEASVALGPLERSERAAISGCRENLRNRVRHMHIPNPYRRCGYCEKKCARRQITISVVHVTVYRSVPSGAKDLRIKKKDGWQAGWNYKSTKCSCGNSLGSSRLSAKRHLSK